MARRRQLLPWPQLALVFGLGGALCTYVLLALTQGLIQIFSGGRLVQGSEGLIALLIAWLMIGGILLMPLTWSLHFRLVQAALIVFVWLIAYLVVWMLGRMMAGMSLPVYLLCWAGFGLLLGYLLGERPMSEPMGFVASARPAREVVRSTGFGRIPQATVLLLSQHARTVTGPICSVLPPQASAGLRTFTVRAVLDRILRDWWENQNTSGLGPQDVEDLKNMVALAVALAAQPGLDPAFRDDLSQAIYRATLAALLDDWLHYWNADGVDGPPRR